MIFYFILFYVIEMAQGDITSQSLLYIYIIFFTYYIPVWFSTKVNISDF
jgi:hypothetical protein